MDFSRHAATSDSVSPTVFRALAGWDQEDERRMVHDFFDDISLNSEEMKLYIAMPEFSIADVRNVIADVHHLRAARKIATSRRATAATSTLPRPIIER